MSFCPDRVGGMDNEEVVCNDEYVLGEEVESDKGREELGDGVVVVSKGGGGVDV